MSYQTYLILLRENVQAALNAQLPTARSTFITISAHRLTAGFQTPTNEKTVGFREGCLKETGAYEGLFGSGSRAQTMI